MKLKHQRGWVGLPNLDIVFAFAVIGVLATGCLVLWLVEYLLQHLHWI